jgi:hypothetical protein
MACRSCQLQIESNLCEVCRTLSVEKPAEMPATCERCQAPLADASKEQGICRLCLALLNTVRENRWFFGAHIEWERENIQLAKKKCELMGTGGPAFL